MRFAHRLEQLERLAARSLGLPKAELDTPCLLIDRDALERNVQRMAEAARLAGKSLRPHAKGHKSADIARLQIQAGAVGVTCAKASEAEAMIASGIEDVMISTVIGSPRKAAAIGELARIASVTAVVDSAAGVSFLADAGVRFDTTIPVLVEVNVGQNRTGVDPDRGVAELARLVASTPRLSFRGIQAYDGQSQHRYDPEERRQSTEAAMARLVASVTAIEAYGPPVEIVSTGGTGTFRFASMVPSVTELQPGSYVLMDLDYLHVQPQEFELSLTVLATVLGRYDDRLVVDAGTKTLSTDAGFAKVMGYEHLNYRPAGDEHGILAGDLAGVPLAAGDSIEFIPSHCDTTANLHDLYFVTVAGTVVDVWPIVARGCVR